MDTTTMENNLDNPFSVVKNTREVWSKFLEQNIREVQVQFADEEPAWIPYTIFTYNFVVMAIIIFIR